MSDQDVDILARTIWGEARSEGRRGMEAVASVVMNRLAMPGWWSRNRDGIPDDTVAAVCMDPWQFSCWNAADPNREKIIAVTKADSAFSLAMEVAVQAIARTFPDPTNGCQWYKVTTLPWPRDWGPERAEADYICGSHSFYRGIDG